MEFVKSQVFDAVNGHYIKYDQHPYLDQIRLRDELLAMVASSLPYTPPPPPLPPWRARGTCGCMLCVRHE